MNKMPGSKARKDELSGKRFGIPRFLMGMSLTERRSANPRAKPPELSEHARSTLGGKLVHVQPHNLSAAGDSSSRTRPPDFSEDATRALAQET